MKIDTLVKKLTDNIDKLYDTLHDISELLEIDMEDEVLAEMSVAFKEQVEQAIAENSECNYNDILEYIAAELQ